ncbi:NAD(P)H-binding protein [Companilactobacillus mishanensis]|uniref:SDR family NAD(P)-dependent oxidoreductase n=1 Tax=Companilactobacillus mishanensis TaxID=2486008 RepID=A0ABW9P426_9LACO|nr:NAD(P)H-binding protein [Companilactobacillus mishanensis]MQS43862.1 SDR family NAD(P)-dependent oxidoreductase [Companilactobacillus mishanensis]
MRYTITGGTGHLGSQIVKALTEYVPASEIRVGVHTVSKAQHLIDAGFDVQAFDFFDEESLGSLLQDTDVFIYVPSKSHTSYSRIGELEKVLIAAQMTEVGHIVAMGFVADQVNNPFDLSAFYGYLPRRLAETGLDYTIIRNALYADPLVPYIPELIERKNIIYPMGNESLSFISLEDSAKAFAKVATTKSLLVPDKIYTLTQSKNYTMPQLAEILTEVSGHEIGYEPMTLQEFADTYNEDGGGHMLASMYDAGSMGLLDQVTDDYQKIMGEPATGLKKFITEKYSEL